MNTIVSKPMKPIPLLLLDELFDIAISPSVLRTYITHHFLESNQKMMGLPSIGHFVDSVHHYLPSSIFWLPLYAKPISFTGCFKLQMKQNIQLPRHR